VSTSRRARPGNVLLAVAYLRVSTDEQKLGPEAQRATIEAWTAREGVFMVAWHTDAGVRGGLDLGDRPGLVAALTDIRAARAGLLVVAKRDRLARDVAVAATVDKVVAGEGAMLVDLGARGPVSRAGAAFGLTQVARMAKGAAA
jgi:DNA invertase Pin-like site-specific DNA recombinase